MNRDEGTNWSTPYVWEHAEGAEIVTTGTDRVRSYDLAGNPLWELTGMSSIVAPTPFSRFGLLYLSSATSATGSAPSTRFGPAPGAM